MRFAVALTATLVVAVSAAPRVLLAAGALPEPLRPFVYSDALLLYVRSLSGHRLPYAEAPFEYPPIIGVASAAFSLLSSNAVTFVAFWGALDAAAAGVAAFVLAGAAGATATARRFALAPQLLLLGALNFDLVAVALLCIAFVAIRAGRQPRGIVFLALGTLSKLFPIVAAPVAIARATRPTRVAALGVAVLALGYVPAAVAGRTGGVGPLYYLFGIEPNFDSFWGLIAYGLAAVVGDAAQAIIVAVTVTGLAVTYVVVILPRLRAGEPVAVAGLAIVTTLIWSRLYSPQYSLWLLPLFVLLPLGLRLFAMLAVADGLVFVTIFPLTFAGGRLPDPVPMLLTVGLVAGVGIRTVVLLGVGRALLRLTGPSTAGTDR